MRIEVRFVSDPGVGTVLQVDRERMGGKWVWRGKVQHDDRLSHREVEDAPFRSLDELLIHFLGWHGRAVQQGIWSLQDERGE